MKFDRQHTSKNVEDRRGQRGTPVKLSVGAVVILLLAFGAKQLLGIDFTEQAAQSLQGKPGPAGAPVGLDGADADAELVHFISFVLDDVQETWRASFAAEGRAYQDARLVLFTESVDSACGYATKAIGPFYCYPDQKVYIDLSFYRALDQRFGAPGDFAQAYVIAHEIGHHLQGLLGIDKLVREATAATPAREQDLAIRQELQADCLAGAWGHATAKRGVLEPGDVKEGLRAAAAIGDDTLQRAGGQQVTPETWTHGSSEQRVRWLERGLSVGTIEACDTFAAAEL